MKKPSPKLCWQLVDSDEDVKKIKEKEAQTTNNSNAPYCRHCDQPVKTRLIAHLLNEYMRLFSFLLNPWILISLFPVDTP